MKSNQNTELPVSLDDQSQPVNKKLVKLVLVLLILSSASMIFYYNQAKVLGQDPKKVEEAKILAIVERVGKIIELPSGEVPVLATVTDLTKLKDQPFFAKAKLGNEVLFYTVAKKAFLYDPKANQIVEVASLNIGQ